jgi:SH3-like domain-containing protein
MPSVAGAVGRRRRARRATAGVALLGWLVAIPAQALDYRSVGAAAAVLYDAPSAKARKLFILNQGYPVEVLVTLDAWLKVRDASGELAWVEAKNLSARRMVMVSVPKAAVHQSPDEGAAVLFQVEQDVLLDLVETTDNWARVKHRDGATGYIRITQVWGL